MGLITKGMRHFQGDGIILCIYCCMDYVTVYIGRNVSDWTTKMDVFYVCQLYINNVDLKTRECHSHCLGEGRTSGLSWIRISPLMIELSLSRVPEPCAPASEGGNGSDPWSRAQGCAGMLAGHHTALRTNYQEWQSVAEVLSGSLARNDGAVGAGGY